MISRRNFMTTSSAGAGTPLSADTKWLTALGTLAEDGAKLYASH